MSPLRLPPRRRCAEDEFAFIVPLPAMVATEARTVISDNRMVGVRPPTGEAFTRWAFHAVFGAVVEDLLRQAFHEIDHGRPFRLDFAVVLASIRRPGRPVIPVFSCCPKHLAQGL